MSYYARPEAAEDGQLEYAASVGADLINHYEEYFNQSYPMDKFGEDFNPFNVVVMIQFINFFVKI